MWFIESISAIPFRKQFLIVMSTLGAVFLLLAYFTHLNPLYHPVVYALLGLQMHLLYADHRTLYRGLLIAAGAGISAHFLLPEYVFLHCILFAFLIGKICLPTHFRFWKWAAASLMLFASVLLSATWQQIPYIKLILPAQIVPIVYATIFSFCAQCSLIVYLVRKNAVLLAIEHYGWERNFEAAKMAEQANNLYQQLKGKTNSESELEEFAEMVIHLCYKLQQITIELGKTDPGLLEAQLGELRTAVEDSEDLIIRKQYTQALQNKERQIEQYQRLRVHGNRIRGQVLNYLTAFENMRFAYVNQEFSSADGKQNLEFFLQLATNRAENVYETSEALETLST